MSISERDQRKVKKLLDKGAGCTLTLRDTGEEVKIRGFKAFATESRVLLGVSEDGKDVRILLDDICSVDWPVLH